MQTWFEKLNGKLNKIKKAKLSIKVQIIKWEYSYVNDGVDNALTKYIYIIKVKQVESEA